MTQSVLLVNDPCGARAASSGSPAAAAFGSIGDLWHNRRAQSDTRRLNLPAGRASRTNPRQVAESMLNHGAQQVRMRRPVTTERV
ncbi:hypothetical protein K377_07311 [Streptomyces sp. PsTaAH-137]|nr:hypothetical protein K377_07311 [Streptomyces sp. PsTaAH-137]